MLVHGTPLCSVSIVVTTSCACCITEGKKTSVIVQKIENEVSALSLM